MQDRQCLWKSASNSLSTMHNCMLEMSPGRHTSSFASSLSSSASSSNDSFDLAASFAFFSRCLSRSCKFRYCVSWAPWEQSGREQIRARQVWASTCLASSSAWRLRFRTSSSNRSWTVARLLTNSSRVTRPIVSFLKTVSMAYVRGL